MSRVIPTVSSVAGTDYAHRTSAVGGVRLSRKGRRENSMSEKAERTEVV